MPIHRLCPRAGFAGRGAEPLEVAAASGVPLQPPRLGAHRPTFSTQPTIYQPLPGAPGPPPPFNPFLPLAAEVNGGCGVGRGLRIHRGVP